MIEPIPETVPIPPSEVPAGQRPKKLQEEEKFAHQLETLRVKEQSEGGKVKEVKDQKRERRELKKRAKGEDKQDEDNEILDTEKGTLIDIEA
jgi:hypothetical protein